MIVGGPGTGKTAILLQIADLLGWDPNCVQISLAEPVEQYIETILGPRVTRCRLDWEHVSDKTIVLVDDPGDWDHIATCYRRAKKCRVNGIVVATDLSQLTTLTSDEKVYEFANKNGITLTKLTTCYRQLEDVGLKALGIVDGLLSLYSKYIRHDKTHAFNVARELTHDSMNSLKFEYVGGHAEIYDPTSAKDIAFEFSELRRDPLWTYWPPLLIVREKDINVRQTLGTSLSGIKHRVITLNDINSVRGVEFQIVVFLLWQTTWHEMMYLGRSGLSTKEYLYIRSLRIPFTRATDRLIVFAFSES